MLIPNLIKTDKLLQELKECTVHTSQAYFLP